MSREEYTESLTQELADCIEFVSLQNLKGSCISADNMTS